MAELDINVKIAENIMGWTVDRENRRYCEPGSSRGVELAARFSLRRCGLPDVSSTDEKLGLCARPRSQPFER